MVSPGQTILASDFLNMISSTSGTTVAVVTTADQRLTIIAKGNISVPAGTPGSTTVNMKINGSTVDTQLATADNPGGFSTTIPVSFIYSAKPGAQTNTITFDQTLSNPKILTFVLSSN